MSWESILNPSLLPAVPCWFGFGVHVVTLGVRPPQLDPVEDGDYGGNYAVEADNCNNQNPVKSTVLYCSYKGFTGYIAMVSFPEYKDQITWFCFKGRREGDFPLASVDVMAAGIHYAEHETDRLVLCVFVQTHSGSVLCRTGTGVACVVVNQILVLKKVVCHHFPFCLWTWHGYVFSGGHTDGCQPVIAGAAGLGLAGVRQSAARKDHEHPASTHLDLSHRERELASSSRMVPSRPLLITYKNKKI